MHVGKPWEVGVVAPVREDMVVLQESLSSLTPICLSLTFSSYSLNINLFKDLVSKISTTCMPLFIPTDLIQTFVFSFPELFFFFFFLSWAFATASGLYPSYLSFAPFQENTGVLSEFSPWNRLGCAQVHQIKTKLLFLIHCLQRGAYGCHSKLLPSSPVWCSLWVTKSQIPQ